ASLRATGQEEEARVGSVLGDGLGFAEAAGGSVAAESTVMSVQKTSAEMRTSRNLKVWTLSTFLASSLIFSRLMVSLLKCMMTLAFLVSRGVGGTGTILDFSKRQESTRLEPVLPWRLSALTLWAGIVCPSRRAWLPPSFERSSGCKNQGLGGFDHRERGPLPMSAILETSTTMDDLSPRHGGSVFAGLVGASQVLGLVSVVLTGVWMGHYRGGFAWDGSAHEFNLHPLCMVLGLIFLHGDVYRVFCNEAKKHVKLLHGFIHLLALIISIVGVVAVFDFHRAAKIPDMYSLHSWCGMATLVFFCLQVNQREEREEILNAECLLDASVVRDAYSLFAPEGVLANMLGILLLLYGVLLVYLITREEYRRPPNPEEESLSVHFKNLTEGGNSAGY
ncbi:hypothetical protein CCH79_00018948, partial [Gambusia affinis]